MPTASGCMYPPLTWGSDQPRADAQQLFKYALDAGLKVAAYSRDPRWWNAAINAVGTYKSQLQFFALDIETDPGIPVTRSMVDGVKAMGVRPIIYSASGCGRASWGAQHQLQGRPALGHQHGWGQRDEPQDLHAQCVAAQAGALRRLERSRDHAVGIQQTFESLYNGKRIDIDSMSADFLR